MRNSKCKSNKKIHFCVQKTMPKNGDYKNEKKLQDTEE